MPGSPTSLIVRGMNTTSPTPLCRLDDTTWERLAPLLPRAAHTGRPRANDRRTIAAILHVLDSGVRWCDLPSELGSYVTAWRRYRDWTESGVWARVWRSYCAALTPEVREALEQRVADNPRARQVGVIHGKESWTEPEALEAAIDAHVSSYEQEAGIAAVMVSNEGPDLSWGL